MRPSKILINAKRKPDLGGGRVFLVASLAGKFVGFDGGDLRRIWALSFAECPLHYMWLWYFRTSTPKGERGGIK